MADMLQTPCLGCGTGIPMHTRRVDICTDCWLLLDYETRMTVINAYATGRRQTQRAAVDRAVASLVQLATRPIDTVEPLGEVL